MDWWCIFIFLIYTSLLLIWFACLYVTWNYNIIKIIQLGRLINGPLISMWHQAYGFYKQNDYFLVRIHWYIYSILVDLLINLVFLHWRNSWKKCQKIWVRTIPEWHLKILPLITRNISAITIHCKTRAQFEIIS